MLNETKIHALVTGDHIVVTSRFGWTGLTLLGRVFSRKQRPFLLGPFLWTVCGPPEQGGFRPTFHRGYAPTFSEAVEKLNDAFDASLLPLPPDIGPMPMCLRCGKVNAVEPVDPKNVNSCLCAGCCLQNFQSACFRRGV